MGEAVVFVRSSSAVAFPAAEARVVAMPSGGRGLPGPSAYELAVANGFTGTREEWVASLSGTDGASAYDLAVADGFVGTLGQWLTTLNGDDGHTPVVEWRSSGGYIQVRSDAGAWGNVVALADISGTSGREIEVQASATHIQWRRVGDASWTNLVALSTLEGDPGNNGSQIELQATSTHVQWRYVGGSSWTNLIALTAITGPAGTAGAVFLTYTGTSWPSRPESSTPQMWVSTLHEDAPQPPMVNGDMWIRHPDAI